MKYSQEYYYKVPEAKVNNLEFSLAVSSSI